MPRLPRQHSRLLSPARLCVCAILAAAALAGQGEENRNVTGVRFWSLGDVTRVAIETDGEFRFRSDRLPNPDRLFFDILGSAPAPALAERRGLKVIPVSDRFLKQIRVALTQRDVTRIVLDMQGPAEFTTSRLDNPQRLIVELHAPGYAASQPPGQPAPFRPPSSAPVQRSRDAEVRRHEAPLLDAPPSLDLAPPLPVVTANESPRAAPGAMPPRRTPAFVAKASAPPGMGAPGPAPELAAPARRNHDGDRSMIRVLGLKVGRIVIDAGHGGHDTGTIGPEGYKEKDLVLDVAKRLGALIEQRLGSEVVYTRPDDAFIPLERRTEIANEARADLFLSIHANSSPLRSASGVETYYLNFTTSKTALEVAARENAGSRESVYELQDLLEKIALKDKVEESREFARRIQDSLWSMSSRSNAKAKDRGVKKAPFVVLIGASMPSVLAEIGFISNSRDEGLMQRADHRQRLAEALYKGLASYAATLSHFQVAQKRP